LELAARHDNDLQFNFLLGPTLTSIQQVAKAVREKLAHPLRVCAIQSRPLSNVKSDQRLVRKFAYSTSIVRAPCVFHSYSAASQSRFYFLLIEFEKKLATLNIFFLFLPIHVHIKLLRRPFCCFSFGRLGSLNNKNTRAAFISRFSSFLFLSPVEGVLVRAIGDLSTARHRRRPGHFVAGCFFGESRRFSLLPLRPLEAGELMCCVTHMTNSRALIILIRIYRYIIKRVERRFLCHDDGFTVT
jgi:hypothetical protein